MPEHKKTIRHEGGYLDFFFNKTMLLYQKNIWKIVIAFRQSAWYNKEYQDLEGVLDCGCF